MRKLLGLIGLGAALTYFLNPQDGGRRRAYAKNRLLGLFRQAKHSIEEPKVQPDDVTLARKVESELFRDAEVPKGQINVNAENGKVYLRGEVEEPELIRDLEEKTRKVQGVQEVENLLHAPGTPAP